MQERVEVLICALRRCDADFEEAGYDPDSDIRAIIRCALARWSGDWSEPNHWLDHSIISPTEPPCCETTKTQPKIGKPAQIQPCQYKGPKYLRDGKFYCGWHDPVRLAEAEKRREKAIREAREYFERGGK